MVGGAVLTPDFARQIGADFYARDAKASADIAKQSVRRSQSLSTRRRMGFRRFQPNAKGGRPQMQTGFGGGRFFCMAGDGRQPAGLVR